MRRKKGIGDEVEKKRIRVQHKNESRGKWPRDQEPKEKFEACSNNGEDSRENKVSLWRGLKPANWRSGNNPA